MSTNPTPPPPQPPSTSTPAPSPPPSNSAPAPSPSPNKTEQSLREELHNLRKRLAKREPLDSGYHFLLLKNSYVKPPKISVTQDKSYSTLNFGADLREAVEIYMNKYGTETPANDSRKYTVGRNRFDLNETKMKETFTIRENKIHEQRELIQASIHASNARRRYSTCSNLKNENRNEYTRKRKMQAMALGLLKPERKRKQRERDRNLYAAAKQKILNAEKELLEIEIQKQQQQQQQQQQQAPTKNNPKDAASVTTSATAILEQKLRLTEQQQSIQKQKEREEQETLKAIQRNKHRELELEKERILAEKKEKERLQRERDAAIKKARLMETPQQALHRLYEPIFTSLWEMEFWDGLNPFRIVIDKSNCADMGAPDYCEVIQNPMNLTYIREKVENKNYMTLQAFFGDVELLINNALLYNSDPSNPYHKAANKMKSKYIELRKKLMLQIEASQT